MSCLILSRRLRIDHDCTKPKEWQLSMALLGMHPEPNYVCWIWTLLPLFSITLSLSFRLVFYQNMVRYRVISLSPSRGSTRNHSTRGRKSPKDHILKLPKTNIVVIKAGNVQFRVNSDILSRVSPIFRDAFKETPPTLPKNRIPTFEVEESAAAMRIFFNMLFIKYVPNFEHPYA